MNTPKRLLSGSDEATDYPTTRRRSRSANDDIVTPIDDEIEQVAKRHCVPSDTVKRIISDLLTETTVIDYLRTRINASNLSASAYFDTSSQLNVTNAFASSQQQTFLPPTSTTTMNEQDPLWLEFLQSLNTTDPANSAAHQSVAQSTVTFDSLFTEDDDDDEEFVGPDEENAAETADERKLRVSKRELALLLKDSTASPDNDVSCVDEELLRADQYESLWTEFLASLQGGDDQQRCDLHDEQQKSVRTTTTEDDDNDDPEFRLPDTDYDVDDDLGDELHVSKRELALLLEDNASILNQEELMNSTDLDNPGSVSSNATCSTIAKTSDFRLTSHQRHILQYQLSAYVQLLTQYILLRRETSVISSNEQPAQQLFKELIYFRDQQSPSMLDIPLLTEAQQLLDSAPPPGRRKALGNHLPFHLMDTFCRSPAFVHDSLLPTCLLSPPYSNLQALLPNQTSRNFVSGEDCLMALGLEQNNAAMLIVGHSDKAINERINSLRYARVRRGKQNPVKAFFTYNSVPDISLSPWYQIPPGYDVRQIYPSGLIEKINVTFPPWFRLSYKRSRQHSKRADSSANTSTNAPPVDLNDSLSASTVYVVVEGTSSTSQSSTSPNKVLQQIHMLHLLNSYPKLQPKQHSLSPGQ